MLARTLYPTRSRSQESMLSSIGLVRLTIPWKALLDLDQGRRKSLKASSSILHKRLHNNRRALKFLESMRFSM